MTGPVKPPVGSRGSVPPSPIEARTPSTTDFRSTLEPPAQVGARSPSSATGEVEGVVAALRDGRLEPGQAVDALVARALESRMAEGLTPSGRAALEQHLRQMLADDPAMAQLVRDLERGR